MQLSLNILSLSEIQQRFISLLAGHLTGVIKKKNCWRQNTPPAFITPVCPGFTVGRTALHWLCLCSERLSGFCTFRKHCLTRGSFSQNTSYGPFLHPITTSSRIKGSFLDPFQIALPDFLFPFYGIFPESGKCEIPALRFFSVVSDAGSGENDTRTSPDCAT